MEKIMWIVIIIWLSLIAEIKSTSKPEYDHLTDLYTDLHANYNTRVKPAIHPGVPIEFHIKLFPLSIIEVNEIQKYMKMNLWMSLEWLDPRLKWNVSDYGGDEEIKIPPTDIWVPDLVLVNSNNGKGILGGVGNNS